MNCLHSALHRSSTTATLSRRPQELCWISQMLVDIDRLRRRSRRQQYEYRCKDSVELYHRGPPVALRGPWPAHLPSTRLFISAHCAEIREVRRGAAAGGTGPPKRRRRASEAAQALPAQLASCGYCHTISGHAYAVRPHALPPSPQDHATALASLSPLRRMLLIQPELVYRILGLALRPRHARPTRRPAKR